MAYVGKFIDRYPSLRPAGVVSTKTGEEISKCFSHEVSEEVVPFESKTGRLEFKLPLPKTNNYKGFFSDVRECLQPEVNEGFMDILTREFQDTVFDSYWKKPLGKVSDRAPMLPAGMDHEKICFGKVIKKDITAGELINPAKPYADVIEESMVGHEMYRLTHQNFHPGEQTHRNYKAPFQENLTWGKSTPSDPQGSCVKKVMTHEHNDKVFVSKILADYSKRTTPLVGKVLAPNGNEESLPKDHAYGRINLRDLYGAGELMKDCPPSLDKIELLEEISYFNELRNQIAKRNLPFPHRDLVDAFHKVDLENKGCLLLEDAYRILADFQILPDKALFEAFLRRVQLLLNNGLVVYEKMADLININVSFPEITKLADVPDDFLYFETTNQNAHKYHCLEDFDTINTPKAGLPPRPHISIKGLLSPNIFSNFGVQPKDFFIARSQEYVRTLFENIGCRLEEDTFAKLWNQAKDANGCVSVQRFLVVLKQCK